MAISKINSKSIEDGIITANDLAAGSVNNTKLVNSGITINGTTIALGASGEIVAGTDWQAVITADGSTATSATAGEGYFIDTTSNAHTINLPGSPSAGDTIAIKDYAGTFATNNLTIGRNGNNIQGVANNSLISTNRASVTLVYVDATKGWLYAVESNVADLGAPTFISATGGTITTSGDFKIHTFTGDGCFVVSQVGNPLGSDTVDYLVVAGGGGGASGDRQGGGGGGGFRESSGAASGCYSASPLGSGVSALPVSVQGYPITVGGGGSGGAAGSVNKGGNGVNSTFSTITSAGGGGAGSTPGCSSGNSGGSGGGAGIQTGGAGTFIGGTGNTPPVNPPQGNSGGTAVSAPNSGASAGGGGAGAAGGNSSGGTGGVGGAGVSTSITGSSVTRSGGGGAGGDAGPSVGGTGGGGNGKAACAAGTGNPGTINTGGGGGGTAYDFQSPLPGGAAGGSGIVIIRYKFQ